MKSRALLVASTLLVSTVHADIQSTVDEWANRFIPEASPVIKLPTYANDLDRAIAEVTAGKYRAALSTLHKFAATPESKHYALDIAIAKAKALAGLGETDAALQSLEPSLKDDDAQVVAGQIQLERNRPAEALAAAQIVVDRSPDSASARLLQGQSLEALGRFPEAVEAYKWFSEGDQSPLAKWRSNSNQFENADEITTIAIAINRLATLTQSFKKQPELNDAILGMFVRAFDIVDRQHIASRIAAAEFALMRGDGKNATKYLGPALQTASRDPHVLRIGIELGLSSNKEAAARQAIELFRDADPDSFDAEFWDTVLLARAQQWVQASDRAVLLLKKFPDRTQALGLAAALEFIRGNEPALDQQLARADQISPGRSDAWLTAGSILSNAFQKEAAERLLKEVVKRTPWENEARHELGSIYIHDGRDADAQAILDEAFQSDPYNIKTSNSLRLLAEMQSYIKLQTEHFIIYADPNADPITAQIMGEYMESVYSDVTSVFQYEPKKKVIVQIFPNDDEFSVRLAGVPGVQNFGVSFGQSMATVAPRRGTKQGNFNWARVMRHEFVHTVNLLQTNHRTPRWLTEGLAVWQENVPFRFKDVPQELYKRTMAGKLFTIKGLPMAFVRPKVPADGEQAYTQSAYLARYMEDTFGRESIVKLLNAYATSKSDEDAFRTATGQSLGEFETAWHAWMKKTVKPWGYDKESTDKVAALLKEGEEARKNDKFVEAEKSLAEAYALQPYNLTVNQRLALVYLQPETYDAVKAIEHLKFLHILELQNNKIAKQIARLYMKVNDLPNALKWAHEATYVDMYDASAHTTIAEIATLMNNPEIAEQAKQNAARIELWESTRKNPTTKPAQ